MKKNIFFIVIFILSLSAIAAQASWMGEAWFWVRVEKVYDHVKDSNNRKVELEILRWAKGGGHGDSYGKKFPGRKVTVDLTFNNSDEAKNSRLGQTFWVKHRAASWLSYDRKNKKRIGGSSKSWKYLGDFIEKPLTITKISPSDKNLRSHELTLVWSVSQNNIVTIKVRYKTFGKHFPKFIVYWDGKSTGSSPEKLTMRLFYTIPNPPDYHYENSREYDDKTLQFDFTKFSGKSVSIMSAGKKLLSFKL